MENRSKTRRFSVIPGGKETSSCTIEGPAARLGLWERFPKVDKGRLAFTIATKIAVLIGMLYFIYG